MYPTFTFFNRRPLQLLAVSVALALVAPKAEARPCVAFDSSFNLYAFGCGGKDALLGTQDKWGSTVNPTDITSNGRPPFDGPQTTCYLSQFLNAIYVLNADQSNPSVVHIYNVAGKSWSTQSVEEGGPDPTSLVTILDHDTNVFYALDKGTLFFLDLGSETTANSTALSWTNVEASPYGANYQPTMALAQNHVHFIDVPGNQPGTASIFVIHFSFFQPDAQSYPTVNGGQPSPETHGQTASFFKTDGVQEEFAFIPDDGSATYVINVENNSTVPLAGPSDKSASTYTASINALVQLTSSGTISFLPYTPGNVAQSQSATWSKIIVQGLAAVTPSNSSSNGTSSATGHSTGTASGSTPSGTSTPAGNNNGAISIKAGAVMALLMGATLAITLATL